QARCVDPAALRPLAGAASCVLQQAVLGTLRLMRKLERDPNRSRPLFAPLIFRLALKLEQTPWVEFSSSATEAVYVLRAARRLFALDAVCTWFDTWLEAESAGIRIERDDLGVPRGQPQGDTLASVETALTAPPIAIAVEVLRRITVESGSDVVALAALSSGATLIERLAGADARARILAALA